MALMTRNRPFHRIPAPPAITLPRPSTRALAAMLSALFVVLTLDAMLHTRAFFDPAVLRAVQRTDLPFLAAILHPVDWLTSGPGAVLGWTVLLATVLLARWWIAALTVLLLPLGGVVNEAVGQITNHARPTAVDAERFVNTTAASFPSGHVAGAVLLYGLLFVIAGRIANRPVRVTVKAASLAIIAVAGFGRLWYGAHWPSDVLGAYLLGGVLLIALVALYRRLDSSLGRLPLIRAATPAHDDAVPHAHALTSLVLFREDTVSKLYGPGLLPRALYWLAFQAKFPYIANRDALDAAMHRRNLAALLTEYWYGTARVARVTSIDRIGDALALTSERVRGSEPTDRAAAKAWLRDLRGRFEEAGLPTWQIDPRQPRAIDNVLQSADGAYQIVDLESGLVAPVASRKTWLRALRRGLLPLYDDVFFDITHAYVAREAAAMCAGLGEAWLAELQQTLAAAEEAASRWRRGEPRLIGRLLGGVQTGFGVRTWPARARAQLAGSQDKSQAWIGRAIERWESEQRVTEDEATAMRAHMNGAEFQAMLPHLGAHIVISIILRFPFGSIARAAWTLGALLTATGRLLTRRIDRAAWKQAWSIHSPLVLLLSTIPGLGTFAYLAARPVRSNRLLLRATADAALQKIPWHLYERMHLRRLLARPVGGIDSINANEQRTARETWLVPQPGFLTAMVEGNRDGRPPLHLVPVHRTRLAGVDSAHRPAA